MKFLLIPSSSEDARVIRKLVFTRISTFHIANRLRYKTTFSKDVLVAEVFQTFNAPILVYYSLCNVFSSGRVPSHKLSTYWLFIFGVRSDFYSGCITCVDTMIERKLRSPNFKDVRSDVWILPLTYESRSVIIFHRRYRERVFSQDDGHISMTKETRRKKRGAKRRIEKRERKERKFEVKREETKLQRLYQRHKLNRQTS